MADHAQTLSFIRSSFRSVWMLELLCALRGAPGREFGSAELVDRLRASDLVVRQSIEALLAAGLVVVEDDRVRYAPATPDLDRLAGDAQALYARRPDMVRRTIVMSGADQLSAFSDAFRLRRD